MRKSEFDRNKNIFNLGSTARSSSKSYACQKYYQLGVRIWSFRAKVQARYRHSSASIFLICFYCIFSIRSVNEFNWLCSHEDNASANTVYPLIYYPDLQTWQNSSTWITPQFEERLLSDCPSKNIECDVLHNPPIMIFVTRGETSQECQSLRQGKRLEDFLDTYGQIIGKLVRIRSGFLTNAPLGTNTDIHRCLNANPFAVLNTPFLFCFPVSWLTKAIKWLETICPK